ncbi:MAG: hypothetical protein ACK53Y_16770, partial [bacterium]
MLFDSKFNSIASGSTIKKVSRDETKYDASNALGDFIDKRTLDTNPQNMMLYFCCLCFEKLYPLDNREDKTIIR